MILNYLLKEEKTQKDLIKEYRDLEFKRDKNNLKTGKFIFLKKKKIIKKI